MAKKSPAKLIEELDINTRLCALHGKEQMLKRQLIDDLKSKLQAKHGEIQTITFQAKTATLADILDEVRSYGLMVTYKLVIVEDADEFVSAHRSAMENYAQDPVDHATLILKADKWNRGNLDKKIAKVGAVIKCESLSQSQAQAWVINKAKTYKTKIDAKTAGFLVQRAGTDLATLETHLSKLSLMVDKTGPITTKLIEQAVPQSSDEQAWAVQEAIISALLSASQPRAGGPNPGGAAINAIHQMVVVSKQPEVLVAYFVADLFRKLYQSVLMKQQGVSEQEIGKTMKLWGPRQNAFMALLRKLNKPGASHLFEQIINSDIRSKSGYGSALRNLECFCAGISQHISA